MNSEHIDIVDFYKPQRQSLTGILILFADAVQKFFRQFWALLLVVFFRFDSEKIWIYIFSGTGFLILFLIYAYLVYRNFTFYIDHERNEFVVKKGVFRKEQMSIPIQKIQQVNINQSFIQKLIHVYSLGIETAGSSDKEVDIRAISHQQALLIKQRLLESDKNDVDNSFIENTSITNVNKPFLKLSLITLLKIALVSNYGRSIALLIGFIGTMYNGLQDLVNSLQLDEKEINSSLEQGFALVSLGIITIVLLIAVLLVNIFSTLIKHYDFEISMQRKLLSITSGLFAKKNKIINPQKTQIISYSQNFFQRKMKFYNLFIKQASSDIVAQNPQGLSVEVPGCSKEERDKILSVLLKNKPYFDGFYLKNYRYFIKVIFTGLLIPISVYVVLAIFFFPEIRDFQILAWIYALLLGIYSYFNYKNARLYISKEFVVIRSGAWDVSHEIIETYKIQGISLRQPFWYKRIDLGHLTLHTAAGDLMFNFVQFSEIQNHVNRWLYEVEISQKEWM